METKDNKETNETGKEYTNFDRHFVSFFLGFFGGLAVYAIVKFLIGIIF